MLSSRAVWAITICHWCSGVGNYIGLAWFPTYFSTVWGVPREQLSLTVMPYLCVIPASALMGSAADHLVERLGLLSARRTVNTIGFAVSAVFWLLVPHSDSPSTALGWLCTALAVHVAVFGAPICAQIGLFPALKARLRNCKRLVACWINISPAIHWELRIACYHWYQYNVALCHPADTSCCRFAVVGGYEASKLDIASAEQVGLLQSLVNTMANTSGLIAVPAAAWIVERGAEEIHKDGTTGNIVAGWGGVFTMVATLYVAASIFFLRWATDEKLFT